MLIVDRLLVSGIRFVLQRIAEAVEREMYDEGHLRDELLAAQMKHELGEIDEEELAAIEQSVLAGLREIAARKRAAAGDAGAHAEGREGAEATEGRLRVADVSVELGHRSRHDE